MAGGGEREVEVKLRFESAPAARSRLEALDPVCRVPRTFEDNVLFDAAGGPLREAGLVLRLRRFGERSLLTLKAPVPGRHRHKVRREHETPVADPGAVEGILHELGYAPVYRYQKYRTVFEIDDVEAVLDETPIGCFVELEGPPDAIDRVAARLGRSAADYLRETYAQLHEQHARERGEVPGDLVFEDGT